MGRDDSAATAGSPTKGIAQRRDGFQRHVAGPLHRPLIVLFEQDGADQTDDGVLVGEDADDVGASLDLAVEPLDRVDRVQLGRCSSGRSCRRARPPRPSSMMAASFGTLGRSWRRRRRHRLRAASASPGEGGGDEGRDNASRRAVPGMLATVGRRLMPVGREPMARGRTDRYPRRRRTIADRGYPRPAGRGRLAFRLGTPPRSAPRR